MDMNQLAAHFAEAPFQVKSVQRFIREPGMWYNAPSDALPGFVFPLQGKAEFVFNGTPYIVKLGNVVHGGASMQLDRRVIGNDTWEYLLVLYTIHENKQQSFSLVNKHFELQIGYQQRLQELLLQLWTISKETNGLAAFRKEMLFRCILEELFVASQQHALKDTRVLFDEIISYMHTNYMELLTVRSIAERYKLNENRLFYLFQKCAGIGPWEYLISYRLNQAKSMLLQLELPIHTIAKNIGYDDPYYFSRIFKKQFGLSPSKFREKFKNSPS